jgi:hypothetical protein
MVFVGRHVHNQNKLQKSLKEEVKLMDIHRTPPDARWTARNAAIVASTLLRDSSISGENLIAGTEVFETKPKVRCQPRFYSSTFS